MKKMIRFRALLRENIRMNSAFPMRLRNIYNRLHNRLDFNFCNKTLTQIRSGVKLELNFVKKFNSCKKPENYLNLLSIEFIIH